MTAGEGGEDLDGDEALTELTVSKNLRARLPEVAALVQLATCPVCYRYVLSTTNSIFDFSTVFSRAKLTSMDIWKILVYNCT